MESVKIFKIIYFSYCKSDRYTTEEGDYPDLHFSGSKTQTSVNSCDAVVNILRQDITIEA